MLNWQESNGTVSTFSVGELWGAAVAFNDFQYTFMSYFPETRLSAVKIDMWMMLSDNDAFVLLSGLICDLLLLLLHV